MGKLTFLLTTLFAIEDSGFEELSTSKYRDATLKDEVESEIAMEEFMRTRTHSSLTEIRGIPSIWG